MATQIFTFCIYKINVCTDVALTFKFLLHENISPKRASPGLNTWNTEGLST